ncbi:MAG: sigma-54-dependent Fis family transcriptional regulator [candidate division Zixibacteria bacterium]|nr:sigma-54-dependent Fis family transcriptional regulator [candidate division Zixibacteria bacterium]
MNNEDQHADQGRILVADNETTFRNAFCQMLEMRGYCTGMAASPDEVLTRLKREKYDLVTLDLDWGSDQIDGLDILRTILTFDPCLPVVMITGHASIQTAVAATRQGAYGYIEKMQDREQIMLAIRNAIETGRLKRENREFLAEIRRKYKLIGISPALQNMREQLSLIAPTDSVVLITGESGTGKELVARQIHYQSRRRNEKFICVDSGVLSDALAESELFGHKKGAYTGAMQDRRGLFEEADGGTLFLDEISNSSLGLQAKLLHVLQEREYRRLGDNAVRHCNVRILAATNRHLPDLINEGSFREDLYYRLKVMEVTVLPLRQRKEDIPPLVEHFFTIKSRQHNGYERRLAPEAVNLFIDQEWPGNVRELENAIERIVILTRDDVVRAEDVKSILGNMWQQTDITFASLSDMTREFRKECIIKAINLANGRIARAAEILQIDRTHLYKLLDEYNLKNLR